MEHKRKRGRPRKNSEVWYHPNSYEAQKQGEEMYNEIMGETKYTKFKSNEERKAYTSRIAKEYLDAHPEEIIKLRDEGLVQEMVDFAANYAGISPLAVPDAPTEEEVYLAKRELEGRPLIEHEEAGKFPTVAQFEYLILNSLDAKKESEQLDNHSNSMSTEAQDRLVEAIRTVNNALHNHPAGSDWDIDKKAYEESKARIKVAIQNEKDIQKEIKIGGATTYPLRNSAYCVPHSDIKDRPQDWNIEYIGGHDPIAEDNRPNIAKVHKDGTVEYLNKDRVVLPEEPDYSKGEYHDSIMDANARTALIMFIIVFLIIMVYILWM